MRVEKNGFKQTEIGLIPEDWEVVKFEDSILSRRIKVGKIKQQEYKEFGKYPVIDQGQNYIAGFCDDDEKVYQGDLPVIMFGDHTRVFKFVNFPFVVGADGVKVLLPNKQIYDPKFLFYAMLTLNIPNRGYNRHYRLLKEKKLPLPPLEEQRKIAKVLDTIHRAIELQDRIIEQAKNLKKSLMQKLFTEGLYGEKQKETEVGLIPKSWEVVRLGEIFEVQQGKQLSRKRKIKKDEIECKFLRTSNVFWGSIKLQNLDTMFVSKKELDKLRVRKGDIFICEGGDVGRTAILEEDIDFDLIFQNHLHRLRPKSEDIYPKFFVYWMEKYIKLDKAHVPANVTTIPNLSASRLKSFLIPLPPLEEQKQIAHILSTVDKKIEIEQRKKQLLKELFKTMLHKLMRGEIRLKEVEV